MLKFISLHAVLFATLFYSSIGYSQDLNSEITPEQAAVIDEAMDFDPVLISKEEWKSIQATSIVDASQPLKKESPVMRVEFKPRTLQKEIETFYMLGSGTMVAFFFMPEDVSHWHDPGSRTVEDWKENQRKAPVMDKDAWYVNLIGHPYSGANYYVAARSTGLDKMESFAFAAAMSTIFWEYGMEAMMENPSWQDIVLTPTLGALFGEGMFQLNQRIEANDGRLFGKKWLGKAGYIVTDLSGALQRGLEHVYENTSFSDIKVGVGAIETPTIYENGGPNPDAQKRLGLKFSFKFKRKN